MPDADAADRLQATLLTVRRTAAECLAATESAIAQFETLRHGEGARVVSPGADLVDVLATTPPDQPIYLEPGEYGPIVLPPHSGARRVIACAHPLPAARLDHRAHTLPHLRSRTAGAAIAIHGGRYHLQGLEASCAKPDGDIVLHGFDSATTIEEQPEDVTHDRCYYHGDTALGQKRGLALQGRRASVLGCVIIDCMRDGQDAQAICGWNGPGPYLIHDNLLEASGENVMFGGAACRIPGLVPSDITVTGNTIRKPLAWKGLAWDVKNLLEIKNGRRLTIRGNVFDGCWSANQTGYAILFTPKSGGADTPWVTCEDVLLEGNHLQHVSSGINVSGSIGGTQRTARITIRQNLVLADRTLYGGDGRFVMVGNGPLAIVVEDNTAITNGTSPIYTYGPATATIPESAFRRNLFLHNKYGFCGDGTAGLPITTLEKYYPGAEFVENVIGGGKGYPAGNPCPTVDAFMAGFVDASSGDYRVRSEVAWAGAGALMGELPGGPPPPPPTLYTACWWWPWG